MPPLLKCSSDNQNISKHCQKSLVAEGSIAPELMPTGLCNLQPLCDCLSVTPVDSSGCPKWFSSPLSLSPSCLVSACPSPCWRLQGQECLWTGSQKLHPSGPLGTFDSGVEIHIALQSPQVRIPAFFPRASWCMVRLPLNPSATHSVFQSPGLCKHSFWQRTWSFKLWSQGA